MIFQREYGYQPTPEAPAKIVPPQPPEGESPAQTDAQTAQAQENDGRPVFSSDVFSAVGQGFMSGAYEMRSAFEYAVSGLPLQDEDYRARLEAQAERDRRYARDEYSPDPFRSSKAAQIVHGLTNGLTKYVLAQVVGSLFPGWGNVATTAVLVGTTFGVGETQRLLEEGVDKSTAQKAGVFSGISNAFWAAVPGAFVANSTRTGVRLATGAGTGAALGGFSNVNEQATIQTILRQADYSKAAEQYDPTDPLNLALGVVLGGAAGTVPALRRPGGASASAETVAAGESAPATSEPATYVTNGGNGPQVKDVEVEDAARIRAQETANTANLPVDQTNGAAVERARKAQSTADRQIREKKPVKVSPEAVDPEKIEAIRKASLERLSKLAASEGAVIQNRDRSSKESVSQMNAIAADPDYLRVATSHLLSEGAPVVTDSSSIPEAQRGRLSVMVDAKGERYQVQYAVVDADTVLTSNAIDGTPNLLYGAQTDELVPKAIAGNGRVTALGEAYVRGTADRYRAEFEADPAHGISPDVIRSMSKPILVRLVRESDLPADIGDRSNQRTTAELNYLETAIQDSTRIDLSQLAFTEDGNVSPESIRQFVALLPEAERGQLIVNGVPTDAAAQRLDRAIFQAAYKAPGLTSLLDSSNATPGVAQLLRALRTLAPRVLSLEGGGAADFRPAIAEVLNEFQSMRASGQKVNLAELAAQSSLDRSAEAQLFLDFLAKNEREKGGVRGIVDAFTQLTEFARANLDSIAQGEGMFGPPPELTRVDMAREFGRITGVEVNERAFKDMSTLSGVAKADRTEQIKSGPELAHAATETFTGVPIEPVPRMELIEVARTPDGKVHRVLGINGDPNLTVLPEGIAGVKPLPVRLQEETLNNGHLERHLADLEKAGYETVSQAIVDIARNYTQIYAGVKEGQIVLVRPITLNENGVLRKGILYNEFQEVSGIYRVGSVAAVAKDRYLKDRRLLWDKNHTSRLQSGTSAEPRTRGLTGPQQPSSENSISEPDAPVNTGATVPEQNAAAQDASPDLFGGDEPAPQDSLGLFNEPEATPQQASFMDELGEPIATADEAARVVEKVEEAREAKIVQESLDLFASSDAEMTGERARVQMVLQDNPDMRVPLDDQGTTITAAELLAREEEHAKQVEDMADKALPVAEICALVNNGV